MKTRYQIEAPIGLVVEFESDSEPLWMIFIIFDLDFIEINSHLSN